MTIINAFLGISAFCILYPYVIYPALMMALAKKWPARSVQGRAPESFSIVLAARNEPALGSRIDELVQMIDGCGVRGEMIVVLDGGCDAVVPIDRTVRVIRMPDRRGKAAAITLGCAMAQNEIVVFADARQTWDAGALRLLLNSFENPQVGAVSGELMIQNKGGVAAGVGLYWRYEKWVRKQESRFHSTVGVTGAICAVRRALFQPLPQGLILDDVYWPLRVSMAGFRTVYEEKAQAFDRLPENVSDEFRRKVRTLSGNFQLMQHIPQATLPWRNPVWWQFISHKLMRLVVPWALLTLLGLGAISRGPAFQMLFYTQCVCYAVALVGLTPRRKSLRLVNAAAAFLLLNAAAWIAFWVWASGRAGQSWKQVSYSISLPANLSAADSIEIVP